MTSCEADYPDKTYIEAMGVVFQAIFPEDEPVRRANGDHPVTHETFLRYGLTPNLVGRVIGLYDKRQNGSGKIEWDDPKTMQEAHDRLFADHADLPEVKIPIDERLLASIRIAQYFAEQVLNLDTR